MWKQYKPNNKLLTGKISKIIILCALKIVKNILKDDDKLLIFIFQNTVQIFVNRPYVLYIYIIKI